MAFLYNRYRPRNFNEVLSQDNVVAVLKNSCQMGKIGHAYLFSGPKGTGKTTLARIMAKAANCLNSQGGEPCLTCKNCLLVESQQSLDITEIDAASHTGVDNIRELKENINLAPSTLKYKIYIIDEAHMLSQGAFNALLKSLEEPPDFVIFILATTEIHKIPPTIISRCQRLDFSRLSNKDIGQKLAKIAQEEKVDVDEKALIQIAAASEGGMRDAESLFEQIINLSDKKVTTQRVEEILGLPATENYYCFGKAVVDNNISGGIKIITDVVYSGYDVNNFIKNLIDYLRDVLLLKISPGHISILEEKFAPDFLEKTKELAGSISVGVLGKTLAQLITAKGQIKDSPLPQLPLELALINIIGADVVSLSNMEGTKDVQSTVSTQTKVTEIAKKDNPAPDSSKTLSKTALQKAKISKKPENFEKPRPKAKLKSSPKSSTKKAKNQTSRVTEDPKVLLDKVYQAWPSIIKKLKPHNHSVWGIIQACQPVGIDISGCVIIKVKYGFHKSRLEDLANKRLIDKVANEVLACEVHFCYKLENEIPAKIKQKNESMISQVINDFDGEIVE